MARSPTAGRRGKNHIKCVSEGGLARRRKLWSPTASWAQPDAYNFGINSNGDDLTVPSTVPAGATITSLSGHAWFDGKEQSRCYSGVNNVCYIYAWACIDVNDTQCYYLGDVPPIANLGDYISWSLTPAGSLPADTTTFHFVFRIENGTGLATDPPVALDSQSRDFTVNYSY